LIRLGGALAVAVIAVGSRSAAAQKERVRCSPSETKTDVSSSSRRPSFADGERLSYDVSFGKVHVGSGEMRFIGRDTVRGHDAWTATYTISGGFGKFSVRDTTKSWFDSVSFTSFRFVQLLNEPGGHPRRDMQIFPERQVYRKNAEAERPSVVDPVDDVSLVYLMRTLALEPGQCYEFHRYFEPDGNPVVVHVVRRERITVPAGTFDAIVLRPEITTSGIFSQNGRAELWLADDSTHAVLQLKSHLAFGSINLYLNRVATNLRRD
jgi:Protein of unknown function (DUF3108)